MKKGIFVTILTLFTVFVNKKIAAQSFIDISAGASTQDRYFSNLSYKYQVNNNFRLGADLQIASPKYRFIDGKLFKTGYATSINLPVMFKITEQKQIRLDGFVRPGIRFQGILDPDGNDKRDSIYNSTAILIDAGLIVNVKITDRFNLNSGVSFPTGYQIAPTALFEYLGAANFHAGVSYAVNKKSILFAKAITGPALGADGDSYKYFWSAQAGLRISIGKKENKNLLLIEPSF